MTQMTAVSLFAGIGGFDLALERNGVKVVASVEIDKHAQSVLRKHFPRNHIFGDIQEVTGEQLLGAGFTPEQGIIVGGFPCQDLSVAGKRAGLAGARSGLFWEICRLLDETKARYFILENVPGLLTSNGGRDMGVVIGALADRGYSIAWRVLDAQFFGVPQRRRRIFIVGCLGDDWRAPAEILDLAEGCAGDITKGRKARQKSAKSTANSTGTSGIVGSDLVGTLCARDYKGVGNWDVAENKLIVYNKSRRAQSVEDDESWVEGGVTPTLNTFDNAHDTRATSIVFYGNRVDDIRIQDDKVNTLQARMGTGGNNMPMVYGESVAYSIREDAQANTFSATPTDTALALQALQPSVQSHHAQIFIAQDQPMVMQDREGKPGGGKGPLVSDKSFSLRTSNFQTLFTSTVRRLTPTECERLQGFPDGWTKGQSDSHRYKQLGNAVAVPVVQWLVERLVEQSAKN